MTARGILAKRRRYGKGEAASEVESAFPELGQRVRTTLEYAEPTPTTAPASPSLVGALFVDTERQARGLEFPAVVPWGRFARKACGLFAIVFVVLVALAYDPTLRIAAQRLFLLPAHYTNLSVEPGDRTLKEGADFTVRATLTGRPVASARWLQRPVGTQDAWTETSLAPASPAGAPRKLLIGTLEAVRKDCRADFEYRVVAGEVESDVFRVSVTHPLTLKSFEAAIEPPAYTRRKLSVAKEGNFRVPEGSKVRFRIALDRAPLSARMNWTPEGSKTPQVTSLRVDGNKLAGELPPLVKDVRYEIIATASDGMKLDPARFLIKVQPDEKPSIRFLKPPETYAVIATTEVPMKVEAGDDYGIAQLGISYQINDGPEETLYLDNPRDQPPSAEALTTLYLEKHKLSFADSLTYRGFVEDNRAPEPHRVSTEFRFIDLLPFKQDYQFQSGGGMPPKGSSVTLEELIQRQRRTLNRTVAHEEERPIDAKVADRLSKEQAELAFVTGEFAQKLGSEFGTISPLDEAARAMESATVTLASRDVPASIPLEQTAIASLIKARQNLRKLLSDSKSAGQCRSIDLQQQQKLRKPPAAEKSREAELAKLEQDIKKLAEEQKAFAEEIDPKSGNGPQLEQKNEPNDDPPSKSSRTKPGPAQRQKASASEAERLRSLARDDRALTDLAINRMEVAVGEVKEADQAIQADRPRESAKAARSAAEHLDRLAEQVAGLKAKELPARLARARDLAQATAKSERDLGRKGNPVEPGEAVAEQQGLVEEVRTLADLLNRIKEDAVEEDRTLARAVARASEANSPAEVEQVMRQASAALASGEPAKSGPAMVEASGKLESLAKDLEAARREYMQPKLQQLLAAEKKAAEVQKALDSATDESKKAEAQKGLSELSKAVDALKAGEGSLKKAADVLAEAVQGSNTTIWTPPQKGGLRPGLFTPPIATTNAVREIAKALQAKIQEIILNDAMVDRDGAVPPGFEGKVRDYFRVLSEDLR